jgi:recombination DNA repair RAD52 pathway protein
MLSNDQHDQLMKPLHPSRVAKRSGGGGKQLSYLEAWDVRAHLIRMFDFGGWSFEVITAEIAYEDKGERNWEVGYKVVGRLIVHGIGANGENAVYTEAAVGGASLPSRGEAHDMAIKTAESDALKRAAMNLGTQFGLSLYDDGRTTDVVKGVVGRSAQLGQKVDPATANDIVNGKGVPA